MPTFQLRLEFIPDGATTMVRGKFLPNGPEFEAYVGTASEDKMTQALFDYFRSHDERWRSWKPAPPPNDSQESRP